MKDVRGTGKSRKREMIRTSRKLICLAVSVIAVAVVLSPILIDNDSSADTGNNSIHMGLYDANDQELTSPLIENSTLSFSTLTTPDGVIYELSGGVSIDSTPAYFLIRADSGTGHGLFKVTAKIEGLDGTWMDYYGIRMSTDDGSVADLKKTNSYEMMFSKGGNYTAFDMNRRYYVSFSTLEGSQNLGASPGTISNFTVYLTAEAIPESHYIEYYSDSNLEDTRLLCDIDTIGPFPDVQSQGRTPIGWIDFDGHIVTEDTLVSDLPSDIILALYGWPVIFEKLEEYKDAEGNDVTDYIRKVIYEDGHFEEYTSKKVEDQEGNTKEETSEKEKDSEGNTTEFNTKTDIEVHGDGSETHNTSTEKKENGKPIETTTVRTEYDSKKTMIEEEQNLKVFDPATGKTDEYNVIAKLVRVESDNYKYKVIGTVEELKPEYIEKVSDIIDEYSERCDCEDNAVRGEHATYVSLEAMGSMVRRGLGFIRDNGDLSVELNVETVNWLHERGSGFDLDINKATEDEMTEAQREIVGDNYAISVVLKQNGQIVNVLESGFAVISVKIDIDSAAVYYVDEGGSSEFIRCSYDEGTQTLEYKVDHFSIFMIVEEGKGVHVPAWPYILVSFLVLILLPSLLLLAYRRRRKEEEQQ